jgi:hypothetical protein
LRQRRRDHQAQPTPFAATNASLTACNNNNAGTGTFDLNSATVTTLTGVTKEFYHFYDLNNGTNQITTPYNYASGAATIYVKVTTARDV